MGRNPGLESDGAENRNFGEMQVHSGFGTSRRESSLVEINAAANGFEAQIFDDRREKWKHSMNEMHERPVVSEANKEAARQGSTGRHVRYVLIISCALVVIAFIAVALFIKP